MDFAEVELSDVRRRENAFKEMSGVRGTPHFAMATAGLPCTTVIGGTDFVTTLPAVTTAPRPTYAHRRAIANGNKMRARSVEYHVITDPHVFSNMNSASPVQLHS
jgi:hypothetical protein